LIIALFRIYIAIVNSFLSGPSIIFCVEERMNLRRNRFSGYKVAIKQWNFCCLITSLTGLLIIIIIQLYQYKIESRYPWSQLTSY
jgi:hypothetical protein